MEDPGRLSVRVERGGSPIARWGFDAVEAIDVPEGLSFSTGLPGGPKESSLTLPRDPTEGYADLQRFDEIVVEGAGAERAWEGRAIEFPGGEASISVEAVGHAAHLSDDPFYRDVMVDRDFERWSPDPTEDHMLAHQAADRPYGRDYSVANSGKLHFTSSTDKTIQVGALVEALYRAPANVRLDRLMYQGTERNIAQEEVPKLYASTDGDTFTDEGNLTLDDTIRSEAMTARQFAMLRMRRDTAGTPTAPRHRNYKKLALYGEGITRTAISGDCDGIAGHDALARILTEAAPLIRYTVGVDNATIETATDFVIPHLTFHDPSTAADAIALVNSFYVRNWYLGDNKLFYWRSRENPRRRWIARRDRGDLFTPLGPEGDDSVNGVVVAYTEPGGDPRTVGPTGSGADSESASLLDESASNPVNAAGIPRRWLILDMPHVTTSLGAIEIGVRHLEALARIETRGQGVLTGSVIDADTGSEYPSWAVRSGDAIRWEDVSGDPWHLIIGTDYQHDSRSATVDLDSPPATVEAYMERLGVALIGRIAGASS